MPRTPKPGTRRRTVIIVAGATLVETAGLWLRARRIGGNVVVRCRQGHLFTTLWIPGASVKSLRLVAWRFQRCPVGRHWSLVTPVDESTLTEDERRRAHEHHDFPLP
ncbi:MAG TPA: hypothetical protein VME22_01670 [Solirubrobacteraceae bacterium]|nr:hypothetical protein [Solirubrobacteraceae bacterium]